MKQIFKAVICSIVVIGIAQYSNGQRYLSDYDSSLFIRDTVRTVIKRLENLSFSGYMQPQFQVAQTKGAPSYNGGNFSEFANNRFMLRRARVKIDYQLPSKTDRLPLAVFTFQLDATERGVITRDMFIRLYEPKSQNFSLVTGFFARPFGYEVNLSSGVRESPERGRMSQILMPGERDLGAMISYDKQTTTKPSWIKWDLGVFNGQGQSSPSEFDSFKDIISRLTLKPRQLSDELSVSAGLSLLYGGWRQLSKYKYEMTEANGDHLFNVDSSMNNIGDKTPRHYFGGDVQVTYKHGWGKTELRGEYWRGKQPGTATSSTNPGSLPAAPVFIRDFDGAFFYFLQNVVNQKNELIIKYDWYDPNLKTSSTEIGKVSTNLTAADIKFSTLGFGFTRYFNDNIKALLYYELVANEKTLLPDFSKDIKDNILTCRIQLRF